MMQPEDLNDNFLLLPADSVCVFVAAPSPGSFDGVLDHPYSMHTMNYPIIDLNMINILSCIKRLNSIRVTNY